MKIIVILSLVIISVIFSYCIQFTYAIEPLLHDKDLKIEKVYEGLSFPVSISFLGNNDMLVLEKNNGTVNRIVNGQMIENPLLQINVDNTGEKGLVGSVVHVNSSGKTNIYLYYTELANNTNDDNATDPLQNYTVAKVSKYDLVDGKLTNPKLLFKLPFHQDIPYHVSGKMVIGPDDNLYIAVGDLEANQTLTQNYKNGTAINGSGGIIRMDLDGNPVESIFMNSTLVNYFAYGIRNSFGMDFDPVTGYLWDTENGPGFGDEINLVQPGFNSGWKKVQGVWQVVGDGEYPPFGKNPFTNITSLNTFGLLDNYKYPKMTWLKSFGINAIQFLNSSNLGDKYFDDMFVGDYENGYIYHFDLDKNRTNILDNSTINMISNIELNGKNHSVIYDLPTPGSGCYKSFKCEFTESSNASDGTRENRSLTLSTNSNSENDLSWIDGQVFNVSSGINYTISTTMAQNPYAVQSHMVVYGFTESTNSWKELLQCPSGKTGLLERSTFGCNILIPNNISKIRPILNAGWSSEDNKEASTTFSELTIYNPNSNNLTDLMPKQAVLFPVDILGNGFGHITDVQVGPDGNLYILSIPTDQEHGNIESNPRNDAVIYKISKR